MKHPSFTDEQLLALTTELGEAAVAAGSHELALSALMGAYATVATAHPCCTQECANNAFRLSMMLAATAAQQNGGPPAHLH